ncbi:MAG: carboxypeptidase-like regulatory domain-containing protein [Lachnospiraceae bacterium]|nr:carboxypeptidase-like regulatory domain-containing protein [Lachnospiraceae bacterium]
MKKIILNISKHAAIFLLSLSLVLLFINTSPTKSFNKSEVNHVSAKVSKKKTVKKRSPYDNIKLSTIRCINSRTYKLSFESNKILLKKELKKSYISLSKNKKKLKANFHSISDNGKKITYLMDKPSIRLLNPGDGSMNGSFNVTFSFCKYKTTAMYTEKIIKNSITGFILASDGTPVSAASISLKYGNSKKLSCKSDNNGQYTLSAREETDGTLTVQKSGYNEQTIDNISTNTDAALCQNFILSQKDDQPLTAVFHISNDNKQSVSNAVIDIIADNKSIAHLNTDTDGNIIISNTERPLFTNPFTIINIADNYKDIQYSNENYKYNNTTINTVDIDRQQTYTFSISESKQNNSTSYNSMQFDFSFNDVVTNDTLFEIQLCDAKPLSIDTNLSINWDNDNLKHDSSYFKIDLFSLNDIYPQSKPIISYNCTIPDDIKDNNIIYFNQLINSNYNSTMPKISDGLYYFCIEAYSDKNLPVGSTNITPVTIQNGSFKNVIATIQDLCSKEFTAFINLPDTRDDFNNEEFTSSISLMLCQNKGNLVIPVAPINIDKCNFHFKDDTSCCISSLILSNLSQNTDYTIIPYSSDSKLTIASSYSFNTSDNTSKDTIQCISSGCINNDMIFSELFQQNSSLSTTLSAHTVIDNHDIRSSVNYPNSVLCFYDDDYNISSLSCINTSLVGFLTSSYKRPFDVYTNNYCIK